MGFKIISGKLLLVTDALVTSSQIAELKIVYEQPLAVMLPIINMAELWPFTGIVLYVFSVGYSGLLVKSILSWLKFVTLRSPLE